MNPSEFKVGDIIVVKYEDSNCDKNPVTKEVKCNFTVRFTKGELVRVLEVSPGWVRVANSLQEVAWLIDINVARDDELCVMLLKQRADPLYDWKPILLKI